MGEDEGSSGAARGAPQAGDATCTNGSTDRRDGVFARILGAISKGDHEDAGGAPSRTPVGASGLANLGRLSIEDVAIPKAEIVSVPGDLARDELVAKFRESGLTRLPVYKGTLDSPLGFVHLKDLALKHGFNGDGAGFSLDDLIRPLIYAPPSMGIDVLLTKMRNERKHMALVIDEYGGVDGLVTIEDLIETVVGQILDEHDEDEGDLWALEKPGVYLADARAPLDEFEAETGFKLAEPEDEEEVDTLGGLVFMTAGCVPARGQMVRHPSGAEFEVLEADPRRVKRLRVKFADAARASTGPGEPE